MTNPLLLGLICCLLIFQSKADFYEDVDFIHHVDAQTFSEQVLRSPGVWVLEFYAPWCPHCKNFQSEYTLAAENLKGLVSFGAVNCDVEENKPLCGYFQVQSLPTIFALKPILEPVEVEGQSGYTKNPVKFEGPLKPAAIAKWAAGFLSEPLDAVIDINSKTVGTFQAFSKAPKKALVFTDKDKKSNLLRAIALNFRIDVLSTNWIPIGLVKHTETELTEKYKITSFPSLVIIDNQGDAVDTYTGQFTVDELTEYLKKHAYTPTEEDLQPQSNQKKSTPPPPPTPAKKREHKLNHVTDQESFDSSCYQSGLCLVAFLDPEGEDHQKYLKTLKELVDKYSSVQFIWMDGNKHSEFKNAFGVADYLPQAVAYQRKAKRYRIFTAGFQTDFLSEFIDLVQAGTSKKGRISTLDKEPPVGNEDDLHEEL
jgi:protein disulfide-isomerase A6